MKRSIFLLFLSIFANQIYGMEDSKSESLTITESGHEAIQACPICINPLDNHVIDTSNFDNKTSEINQTQKALAINFLETSIHRDINVQSYELFKTILPEINDTLGECECIKRLERSNFENKLISKLQENINPIERQEEALNLVSFCSGWLLSEAMIIYKLINAGYTNIHATFIDPVSFKCMAALNALIKLVHPTVNLEFLCYENYTKFIEEYPFEIDILILEDPSCDESSIETQADFLSPFKPDVSSSPCIKEQIFFKIISKKMKHNGVFGSLGHVLLPELVNLRNLRYDPRDMKVLEERGQKIESFFYIMEGIGIIKKYSDISYSIIDLKERIGKPETIMSSTVIRVHGQIPDIINIKNVEDMPFEALHCIFQQYHDGRIFLLNTKKRIQDYLLTNIASSQKWYTIEMELDPLANKLLLNDYPIFEQLFQETSPQNLHEALSTLSTMQV